MAEASNKAVNASLRQQRGARMVAGRFITRAVSFALSGEVRRSVAMLRESPRKLRQLQGRPRNFPTDHRRRRVAYRHGKWRFEYPARCLRRHDFLLR